MSKKPSELYNTLKEYVTDYVNYMETLNDERSKCAEKEFNLVRKEILAFGLLVKNLKSLEVYGVS